MAEIIIDTPCGKIKGSSDGKTDIFKGIRYAESERFSMPVITERWSGIYDAVYPGPECYQYASFMESGDENAFYRDEFYNKEDRFKYEENALTLNIISPSDQHDLPVIAYIHGGGFETGTTSGLPIGYTDEYAKRKIILVSIGYRLNVFSLYRGKNLGLFDQICALIWIKKNIKAFGGDPDKVTVMGQSAGAMSITDLCMTDLTDGLFRAAVMISGAGPVPNIFRPETPEELNEFWNAVMRRAGASDDEEMKKIPPEKLWNAWFTTARNTKGFGHAQPAIDGRIIRRRPEEALSRGEEKDIPYLISITSQDFMTGVIFEMAYRWAAQRKKHSSKPVYGYFFDRTPPGDKYKAFHACDLWYLFGNMEKSWRKFEDKDRKLSKLMIDYVAEFAGNGMISSDNLPEWKPMGENGMKMKIFDTEKEGYITPKECRMRMAKTALLDKGPM
jgi:carboxylesterase type B